MPERKRFFLIEVFPIKGPSKYPLRNWSAKGEGGIPPKSVNRNTVPPYGRFQDFFAKYFFGFLSSSSRTRARPVWSLRDKRATSHHHRQWQLQTDQTSNSSSSGSRWAREELKKEIYLNTISKMMDTIVHVQLSTFSYRNVVNWPQNIPKNPDWR